MIGAEPPALQYRAAKTGATVLDVKALDLVRESPFGVDLHDISLQVRAGEVVGIAGVSGNGQRELLFALSGEDTRAQPGMIEVAGQPVGRSGPASDGPWACISCRRSAWAAARCRCWAWPTTSC
jgi:ABC-type uncharacterized transport system ATPase subunit